MLSLKQQTLTHESCEALEELFKRVKYRAIDVTSCSLDDSSASSLFDMIEYYEACNELNFSENPNIKNRGWLACKFQLCDCIKSTPLLCVITRPIILFIAFLFSFVILNHVCLSFI